MGNINTQKIYRNCIRIENISSFLNISYSSFLIWKQLFWIIVFKVAIYLFDTKKYSKEPYVDLVFLVSDEIIQLSMQ